MDFFDFLENDFRLLLSAILFSIFAPLATPLITSGAHFVHAIYTRHLTRYLFSRNQSKTQILTNRISRFQTKKLLHSRLKNLQLHYENKTNEAMSYFFSSIFGNDEKQASNSPVKSTEEEKLTKAEGKQNEQEQESEDIMATPRKGWLDWPFWKRNDNSGGGPFNAFRKNKNPGAFTWRKDLNYATKPKECGKGEGSKDLMALNVGTSSSESGEEEGQSKATESITKTENTDGGKSSVRYVRVFILIICTRVYESQYLS